jgi:hypothetical protein
LAADGVRGSKGRPRGLPFALLGQAKAPTLAQAYDAWQRSRVDVSAATGIYQRSAIRRAKPLLNRRVDDITASDVADLVADLAAAGNARETIRKTVTVLSMVFDHVAVSPNQRRDRRNRRHEREVCYEDVLR